MARVTRLPFAIASLAAATLIATAVIEPHLEAKGIIPALLSVAFTATGAVVAVRVPRNAIGWLFLATGLAAGVALLSHAIPDRLIANGRHDATVTGVLGAYASASWVPFMLPPLTLTLLIFPDGRPLPGRRWRAVAWGAIIGMVVAFAGTLLAPGPLEDYRTIVNPIGIDSIKGLDGPGYLLMFVSIVAGPTSLWLRFRRADRVTREQIRWLAAAGAFAALAFVVGLAGTALVSEGAAYAVMMLGVLALPVVVAASILRYRLYDIDVVVNRALVYTALTATLVGAYLLTVLLAQLVLPARSDLGVAISTLAAAAVFTPARRRIQGAVDRRFFRRRFDAQQTLESFGARLRDEVDLDALSRELNATVADTMQPASLSLWLREPV